MGAFPDPVVAIVVDYAELRWAYLLGFWQNGQAYEILRWLPHSGKAERVARGGRNRLCDGLSHSIVLDPRHLGVLHIGPPQLFYPDSDPSVEQPPIPTSRPPTTAYAADQAATPRGPRASAAGRSRPTEPTAPSAADQEAANPCGAPTSAAGRSHPTDPSAPSAADREAGKPRGAGAGASAAGSSRPRTGVDASEDEDTDSASGTSGLLWAADSVDGLALEDVVRVAPSPFLAGHPRWFAAASDGRSIWATASKSGPIQTELWCLDLVPRGPNEKDPCMTTPDGSAMLPLPDKPAWRLCGLTPTGAMLPMVVSNTMCLVRAGDVDVILGGSKSFYLEHFRDGVVGGAETMIDEAENNTVQPFYLLSEGGSRIAKCTRRRWRCLPTPTRARANAAYCVWGDRIVMAGGNGRKRFLTCEPPDPLPLGWSSEWAPGCFRWITTASEPLRSCESLRISPGGQVDAKWQPLPDMIHQREHFALAPYNGSLIALAGLPATTTIIVPAPPASAAHPPVSAEAANTATPAPNEAEMLHPSAVAWQSIAVPFSLLSRFSGVVLVGS